MWKTTLGVGFAVALALAGCGEDEKVSDDTDAGSAGAGASSGGGDSGNGGNGGTGGGGGTGGAGASGGSAGSGGSGGTAGSAGTSGAGGEAGGTSGACNYLTQLGLQVTAQLSAAQTPQAEGGTLTDGFYKLVGATLYGGATGTTYWRSLRLVGNELKTVERDGAATSDVTTAGTYTLNGMKLVRNDTCPTPATHDFSYTSDATTLTLYESQGGNKTVELVYDFVNP